jgi:hypothetical protein
MDPWTLAKLAGHRDMAITKRYIHPEEETIRAAMERVRNAQEVQEGHKSGHNANPAESSPSENNP